MTVDTKFGRKVVADLCETARDMAYYNIDGAQAWNDVGFRLAWLIGKEVPPVNMPVLLRQAQFYARDKADEHRLKLAKHYAYTAVAKRLRTIITAVEVIEPQQLEKVAS